MHQKSGYVTVHVYRGWGVTDTIYFNSLISVEECWKKGTFTLHID